MKRRYEVRWYEYNMTQPMSRKFFTEMGACMFMCYLWCRNNIDARIYYNNENYGSRDRGSNRAD